MFYCYRKEDICWLLKVDLNLKSEDLLCCREHLEKLIVPKKQCWVCTCPVQRYQAVPSPQFTMHRSVSGGAASRVQLSIESSGGQLDNNRATQVRPQHSQRAKH